MTKKKRFSKQDLLSSGMGKLFETLDGKLPKPPTTAAAKAFNKIMYPI